MTLFRPCIDLHEGRVKQIVGGSLGSDAPPKTNFVAEQDSSYFAELYRRDRLTGGHLIQLGPGNDTAALSALSAWPKGLQLGGGVTAENARAWLDRGASKVIVTSWLFEAGELSENRLSTLTGVVTPEELVIDLSCRRRPDGWYVATDRWQTITSTKIETQALERLARHCSEFLVHAVDVEGLCRGIDEDLVELLGKISPLPCTYAGGARDLGDLDRVAELSLGRVDLTFGSALDIFGGTLVKYADCVRYNRAHDD
jgi:phosphoribosylformimino-5-aminoimidazole carboxamide ribotide isomerase